MSINAGVGTSDHYSHHHNPNVAGREAAEQTPENGKPAIEVLKEYLPEHALVEDRDWMPYAIALALIFKAPSYIKDEEYVVRGVPAVRMADGSITVQTEVPEGTSFWFSSRDKEKIATKFERMAQQIKEQLGGEKP